jgi:hypothetical protein
MAARAKGTQGDEEGVRIWGGDRRRGATWAGLGFSAEEGEGELTSTTPPLYEFYNSVLVLSPVKMEQRKKKDCILVPRMVEGSCLEKTPKL